jgi:predicted Ser/Thr protein kinase
VLFSDSRNQIRALYAALHRAGVRHGDVGWQHVLRCGMEVRLIDFDRATVRPDTTTDTEWDRLCEAERGYVHLMLRNPADMNTA